tara:strand:- start:263 stop:532 length:270 start_codon:yes stop_codon:yes gene_type:complete
MHSSRNSDIITTMKQTTLTAANTDKVMNFVQITIGNFITEELELFTEEELNGEDEEDQPDYDERVDEVWFAANQYIIESINSACQDPRA